MTTALASIPVESVQIVDGHPMTTSQAVADAFGKRHDHVVRAIRNLEVPDEWRLPNFGETVFERPNPSGGKAIASPAYRMTRDGFTVLVMGFTGKDAMKFKLAFIERFNEMERELKERELAENPRLLLGTDALAALDRSLMVARRECQALRNAVKEGPGKHYHLPKVAGPAAVTVADLAQRNLWELFPLLFDLLHKMDEDHHDVDGPLAELWTLVRVAKEFGARATAAAPFQAAWRSYRKQDQLALGTPESPRQALPAHNPAKPVRKRRRAVAAAPRAGIDLPLPSDLHMTVQTDNLAPRYPKGTTLIGRPGEMPEDGDTVLVPQEDGGYEVYQCVAVDGAARLDPIRAGGPSIVCAGGLPALQGWLVPVMFSGYNARNGSWREAMEAAGVLGRN